MLLSGSTALIGAVLGAVLAWLIVSSPPTSMVRRAVISLCSVLAQFGGVALAFAFLATVGLNGVLTLWVQQAFGWNLAGSGWLYSLTGLILVYTYFQIPLMVIVFLPALEGLREQWREAAVSLGASTWQYWREVAVPLLTPAFLGSALLLFANAFAAYATAAALVSQGSPIVPLLIRSALTSEVVLGQSGFAYALALEMIVVVAVVMVAYNAAGAAHREVAAMSAPRRAASAFERRCGWLFGLFFLFPLYAMADFSTRNLIAGGRTWQAWTNLVADDALYQAIVISLLLAVLTVVAMLLVLVPTMIWVRLRAPWAKGVVEFLCLLPLTIPALVIVVGLRNVYLWVTYFLGESALTLTFVYVVLVLPFAYRAHRRRAVVDRPADARRGGALAGRRLGDDDPAGGGAQHLVGHPVGRIHLDRGRARRVHHRVADRLSRPCRCRSCRSARATARPRWPPRWPCCCSVSFCC